MGGTRDPTWGGPISSFTMGATRGHPHPPVLERKTLHSLSFCRLLGGPCCPPGPHCSIEGSGRACSLSPLVLRLGPGPRGCWGVSPGGVWGRPLCSAVVRRMRMVEVGVMVGRRDGMSGGGLEL